MMLRTPRWLYAAVVLVALPTTPPDEGMWPFDGLPLQYLKDTYDFTPTPEWLDHVRLGSVRFDTGGSGSFVSPHGLVMTNHHVALETLQKVSTQEKDWVETGFSSKEFGSEVPGTDLTLRQLIEVRDVTEQVLAAGREQADATMKGLCMELSDEQKHLVADPVVLYDGGQYKIYVYHVYDDVRVVFAPEKQVAFFGGDYDNFTYPRYCLDCAFFRVYEDGKPVDSSKWYFKWNADGARKDDLVFVSGHPGQTERLLTYDEMVFHRDVQVPFVVRQLTGMLEHTRAQMEQSEQAAFELRDRYFGLSNSLKAYEGHLAGLRDDDQMARIKARDEDLIAKAGDPAVQEAFEAIATAMNDMRGLVDDKETPRSERLKVQRRIEREVLPPNKEIINKARFAVYGTSLYPDATFTLRLAFGTVKGYEAGTTLVPPKTTINGLYDRNAGFDNEHPWDLPQRWLDAKSKLDLDTPYNFVCTADIIGGNSGSPILSRDAEIVGLVFDGNIESLPGNYWFDERINRCVGVHAGGMLEAIDKVYGEKELVAELRGSAGPR
ncbi:MAG: S46 family peptidase [Planctomycetota bacterium]